MRHDYLIGFLYIFVTFAIPLNIYLDNEIIVNRGNVSNKYTLQSQNKVLKERYVSPLNFTWWSEDLDYTYNYQLYVFSNMDVNKTIPDLNTVPIQRTNFTVSLNCSEFKDVDVIFFFIFTNVQTTEKESMYIYWETACANNVCQSCKNNGTCNYQTLSCLCPPGYNGDDCSIYFDYYPRKTVCPFETFEVIWDIPSSTLLDWLSFWPLDNVEEVEALHRNTMWFYTNSMRKVPGSDLSPKNKFNYYFVDSGEYIIQVLQNDGYEAIGEVNVKVLTPPECNITCDLNKCIHGTCVSGICECENGYYGLNCELGCSGTIIYDSHSATFDDGSEDYYIRGDFSCVWVVEPKEKYSSITVNFNYLDIGGENPLLFINDTDTVAVFGQDSPKPYVFYGPFIMNWTVDTLLTNGFKGFKISYQANIEVEITHAEITYSHPAAIAILTFFAILFAYELVCTITFIVLRNHYIVRASSWVFCLVISIGAMVGLSTIIPLIGEQNPGKCVTSLWLVSIGFVTVFSSLFAKNHRIAKIFQLKDSNKKNLNVKVITNISLAKIVGGLIFYELVYLIIWTAVDYPTIQPIMDNLQKDTDYTQCVWKYNVFPILSIFFKVLLMIWGIFLTYKTRNAGRKYRESKVIGAAIYNCFFCFLIFIPLLIFLDSFRIIKFLIQCIGIIFIFGGTTFAVFGRILHYLVWYFDEENKPKFNDSSSMEQVVITRPKSMSLTRIQKENSLKIKMEKVSDEE